MHFQEQSPAQTGLNRDLKESQIKLPAAPTTFTAGLSEYKAVDIEKRGLNEIMHRPVEAVQAGFNVYFTISSYIHFSVSPLLASNGELFRSNFGTIAVTAEKDNIIRLHAQGLDPKSIQQGNDSLAVIIKYNDQLRIEELQLIKTGLTRSMSRSTFSLLLRASGFVDKFPQISTALIRQFVLEPVTTELAQREELAYRQISLTKLDAIIAAENPAPADLQEVKNLRLSKSQEIRRLAVQAYKVLADRGLISEDDLALERELSFKEDVREDLVFIERSLRNNQFFISSLFENLFQRKEQPASLVGSRVFVNYFARGHNKQIYTVDWVFPDSEKRRFAISSIRDAQLGQGDFGEEEIRQVLTDWQWLSHRKVKSIATFGASELHGEWRTRYLEIKSRAAAPALSMFANNFFLIGREFIDDATPLYCMLHDSRLSNQEKLSAMEAAAVAYWDVWASSKDQNDKGFFLRTPRAEDVVITKLASGEYLARIIDLDTLSREVSLSKATEYFRRYSYYPEELLQRALAKALQSAEGSKRRPHLS